MRAASLAPEFSANADPQPQPEKLYPISFRVTAKEKARIKGYAGEVSVSQYLRHAALKGNTYKRKADTSIKVEMAAKILGALGQSEISSNLRRIADAAELGAPPMTEELRAELKSACALVLAIRCDLIEALGIYTSDRSLSVCLYFLCSAPERQFISNPTYQLLECKYPFYSLFRKVLPSSVRPISPYFRSFESIQSSIVARQ